MSKRRTRRKVSQLRTSVRLPEEATAAVKKLAGACGWSDTAALGFLARAGAVALYAPDPAAAVVAMRQVLSAAVDSWAAQQHAKSIVSQAAAGLRTARKGLAELLPGGDLAELPDRPPAAPGDGLAELKRRTRRPRQGGAAAT